MAKGEEGEMKRWRWFWLVVTVLTLMGCTQKLVKYGASESEVIRDDYECRREAYMLPQAPPAGVGAEPFYQGWNLGQSIARNRMVRELYTRCMMSRGYMLEE